MGCQGQYTIQIQMDVVNDSGETAAWEFYQVFMMEGTFSISENFARASLGNLNNQMVLQTKMSGREVDYHHYVSLSGGGFWSGLKSFVNKIATGVGSVARFVAPVVSAIAPEFSPIVAGVSGLSSAVKDATGGRLAGGMLAGGSRVSRRAMRR